MKEHVWPTDNYGARVGQSHKTQGSGFGYTDNTDQFSVGFGLFVGFADNKRNTEYNWTYPLNNNLLISPLKHQKTC